MASPEPSRTSELDIDLLGARALVPLFGFIGPLVVAGGAAQWWLLGGGLGPWNVALGVLFVVSALGSWRLTMRGRPRVASALLLVMALFGLAAQALITGLGMHSLALAGGPLLVVLAGALLGLRWSLAMAGLHVALVLALFIAERSGAVSGLAATTPIGSPQRLISQLMLAAIAVAVGLLVVRLLNQHLALVRQHEERSAELLRIGSDWTWELDARGAVRRLSPSFEANTGHSLDEFTRLGEPGCAELLPDAEYERLLEDFRARRPFQGRVITFRCADGSLLYARGDGDPVFDARGRLTGWRGVSRNVTREQLALRAQRRTEAMLDRLVRNSPDPISVARLNGGRVLLANPAFMAQSGIPEAEVIGRSALELGLWRDVAEPLRLAEALRRDGVVHDHRTVFYPRGRGPRDVMLTAAVFEWDADPVVVITTRDITDSERARIEGDAILDNAGIGIALVRQGRFERVNPGFARLFGRAPAALVGEPAAGVWPAAVPAPGAEAEREVPQPDGAPARLLLLHVARVGGGTVAAAPGGVDGAADESATVWLVEDITPWRRAQRELAAAKQQAEAANEAKSRFLATMSHEIRTPLNGVLGLARLLQDPALGSARREEYLGHLIGAAEQLSGIVSDVLDLSKIESGHVQIERVAFDLRSVIDSSFHTFAPLGRERGLTLRCAVDERLPQRVLGDPVRVRQILSNYLANALKFTRQGEVVVRVGPGPANASRIRLAVQDSGIGIAPEVRDRLFRPFAQADDSTTRRYGGTGLGLSICHELATRMGGEVGVDSDGEHGSTFWADLPLPAESADDAPPRPAPASPDEPLAGLRVLLAEDNPVNLLVACALLGRLGATVIEAQNGNAAVALAREHHAELHAVLMDLHMPGLDGLTATRQLRDDPRTAQLPVFAFSAAVLEQERRAARAAGMNGFVAKPIDAGELLRVLQPLRAEMPR